MKKILIALALIGCYSAEAQTATGNVKNPTQKSSTEKSGDTYVVCTEEGGFYNCCVHHKKRTKSVAKKSNVVASPKNAIATTNSTAAKPKHAVVAPVHRVALKHKRNTPSHPVAAKGMGGACRMIPFQVCKINPDRRSVTCYPTTDADELTPSGPGVTYLDTGAMPGQVVHFKVKTIVIKGEDKGAYCRRNKENNATICSQPGLIVRDRNGYYSYGEPASHKIVSVQR
jgi:hypothetical protein